MALNKARNLISQGYGYKEVPKMAGITLAQFYQIKREMPAQDFGCVVCGSERQKSKLFCRKHKYKYVENPKRIKRIKGR